jgi:hypothetical protein
LPTEIKEVYFIEPMDSHINVIRFSFGSGRFNLKEVRQIVSRPFLLCMACLNVLLFSCRLALGDGENATETNGILVGTVTKGPISPLIKPNVLYAPVPVGGVKVMVTSRTGKQLASTLTDRKGNFRIVLSPGIYQVTLGSLSGGAFSKDVPATITIRAGLGARMAIHVDTGIR